MWDLPRSGIQPCVPALAGRSFTTEPPGKPPEMQFLKSQINYFLICSLVHYFLVDKFGPHIQGLEGWQAWRCNLGAAAGAQRLPEHRAAQPPLPPSRIDRVPWVSRGARGLRGRSVLTCDLGLGRGGGATRGRTKAVSDHLIPVRLRLSWPWQASPESQGIPRSWESQNGWFPYCIPLLP